MEGRWRVRPDASPPAPDLRTAPADWRPTDRAVQLLAELLVRVARRQAERGDQTPPPSSN
jgi:hypothetical protein